MFANRPALGKKNELNQTETNSPDSVDLVTENLSHIRDEVQKRVLTEFDGEVTLDNIPRLRTLVESLFDEVLAHENLLYAACETSPECSSGSLQILLDMARWNPC